MSYGFGIVGLGLIADFHARAVQAMERGRMVACLSRSEDKANAFGKKFGCTGHTNIKDFLAEEDLDIVTVCTPSGNHLEPGLEVIAAGKHVILEKPMEITLKRCDTLIDAARGKGVCLSTIFPSRFTEVSQVIKKAVDAGRFGRLVLGDAYCKWFRSQAYYDEGGWKGTQALDGGGALMNQSIHAIDQLQWFMGPIKCVQACKGILGHERIEVEDTAVAIVEFVNGAMGVIEGTTAVYPGWAKRIEINGTKGSMTMVEADLKAWEFESETEEDAAIREKFKSTTDSAGGAADPAAISFKPHQWQFEEFVEALETNRPGLTADDEGRKAVEIILAIYKSARSGKKVSLPL